MEKSRNIMSWAREWMARTRFGARGFLIQSLIVLLPGSNSFYSSLMLSIDGQVGINSGLCDSR